MPAHVRPASPQRLARLRGISHVAHVQIRRPEAGYFGVENGVSRKWMLRCKDAVIRFFVSFPAVGTDVYNIDHTEEPLSAKLSYCDYDSTVGHRLSLCIGVSEAGARAIEAQRKQEEDEAFEAEAAEQEQQEQEQEQAQDELRRQNTAAREARQLAQEKAEAKRIADEAEAVRRKAAHAALEHKRAQAELEQSRKEALEKEKTILQQTAETTAWALTGSFSEPKVAVASTVPALPNGSTKVLSVNQMPDSIDVGEEERAAIFEAATAHSDADDQQESSQHAAGLARKLGAGVDVLGAICQLVCLVVMYRFATSARSTCGVHAGAVGVAAQDAWRDAVGEMKVSFQGLGSAAAKRLLQYTFCVVRLFECAFVLSECRVAGIRRDWSHRLSQRGLSAHPLEESASFHQAGTRPAERSIPG